MIIENKAPSVTVDESGIIKITDSQFHTISLEHYTFFSVNVTAITLIQEVWIVRGEMEYLEMDYHLKIKGSPNEYIFVLTVDRSTITVTMDQWRAIAKEINFICGSTDYTIPPRPQKSKDKDYRLFAMIGCTGLSVLLFLIQLLLLWTK